MYSPWKYTDAHTFGKLTYIFHKETYEGYFITLQSFLSPTWFCRITASHLVFPSYILYRNPELQTRDEAFKLSLVSSVTIDRHHWFNRHLRKASSSIVPGLCWALGIWDELSVIPSSKTSRLKGRVKEENAQLQCCSGRGHRGIPQSARMGNDGCRIAKKYYQQQAMFEWVRWREKLHAMISLKGRRKCPESVITISSLVSGGKRGIRLNS